MITVVTICYTNFKKQSTSTSLVFTRQNILKKPGEMFIEHIIEFELRGSGPSGRPCNPKTGYFYNKTKISKKKSSSELLLTAKYVAEGNVPCFLFTWTKSITKFIQKMLGF